MTTRALVVLSGGQDSTTCLYWAKQRFAEVCAVTINYGQRHSAELIAAEHVGRLAGVFEHMYVDARGILRSASPLTSSADLEQYENAEQMSNVIGDRVELTFVPMRNTLFLTIAANLALSMGCRHLVTGICQEDNANYPDCTELFRSNLEATFNISLGIFDFKIHAPLMNLSKADTCVLAASLPGCWEALAYTHTSYAGEYPPTDMNHANVLRAKGFQDAGLPDPLVVRAWNEGLMGLPETSNYDEVRGKYNGHI